MKVKVTQTFRDKDNYNLVYKVGEEREFGKSHTSLQHQVVVQAVLCTQITWLQVLLLMV